MSIASRNKRPETERSQVHDLSLAPGRDQIHAPAVQFNPGKRVQTERGPYMSPLKQKNDFGLSALLL